jgi:hypothetical protein
MCTVDEPRVSPGKPLCAQYVEARAKYGRLWQSLRVSNGERLCVTRVTVHVDTSLSQLQDTSPCGLTQSIDAYMG